MNIWAAAKIVQPIVWNSSVRHAPKRPSAAKPYAGMKLFLRQRTKRFFMAISNTTARPQTRGTKRGP